MQITASQLRAILVESGLITAKDFDSALAEAAKRGVSIENALVDQRLVPDHHLGQLIADTLGYPFARLDVLAIPDHILRIIPERVAKYSKIIAFGKDERGRLKVALRDPTDIELVRLVEKKMGVRAIPHFATESGIHSGIERYTKDLNSAVKSLFEEKTIGRAAREEVREERIIHIVDLILNYAYQNSASDVHIEPRQNEVFVRYRIDGILHDVVTLSKEFLEALVSRIKIMSKLRTDEHFAAQDSKFQEVIEGERVDVRVSVIPIVYGEKVVMRLLTERGKKFTLEDLGIASGLKKLNRHLQKSFGMILATGPTGSGKTTTMYAILKILNTRDVNIATIEDPIEYALEGVNQIQVNPKTGLTFASGLRSIVRQDPDIIMVGEIRDDETAGIAVNAALTGHLVLSTLHTNDAATTLPRLRDMKIEPFLIASTVNVIIAQRLVRKICSRCIMSRAFSREELKKVLPENYYEKFLGKKQKLPVSLYQGKGCDRCGHTGYAGRVGIFEILEMNDNIRELIMRDANASEIAKQAVKDGMATMFEDGLQKVFDGITSLEEVLKVSGQ